MDRVEKLIILGIVLITVFVGYAIVTTAQAYKPEPPHVPIEREWHSPYPTGQSNE